MAHPEEEGPSPAQQQDADDELNTNLHEVLDLMSQQVERLKVSLDFFRLAEHENKEQIIRWHVREIDERQDRMDELKALILAEGDADLH